MQIDGGTAVAIRAARKAGQADSLVLTGRCLDRCTDKSDWLKREIVHALATGRNIIPVLIDDFRFPFVRQPPKPLPLPSEV